MERMEGDKVGRRNITDLGIKALRPKASRYEKPAGGSLYVVVQPSGRKSYAVRYRFGGKTRKLTLPGGLTLAAARKAEADALYELERGRDPGVARQHAKQAQRLAAQDTFQAIAEEYLKREGNGLRSADDRRATLERLVYPTLGERPIADIRRSEIVRLLDKIEEASGPVMADRTLAYIRKIMNWHATRSDDFKSPIVRGMARTKPKERARDRTLDNDELRVVWNVANAGEGPFHRLVQFLLLTAARRNEAAEMQHGELSGADWTLPAARNKAKVDLIRPLSEAAQSVLARTPRLASCDYVFTTDGKHPISGFSRFKRHFDKAVLAELKKRDARAKPLANWTLHDLRRTARSLMSRAGVNTDHAERCLGHVIPGVRGTYDRHEYYDEKREVYEALAKQIDRIVNPLDNVAELETQKRRRRR
jgi:Arm DNA-binding domain/Phage integrase family